MEYILLFLVAYLGYRIAYKLKVPAPAMIGSLIAVGLVNVIFGLPSLSSSIKSFTQSISGIFIGMQVHRNDLYKLSTLWKPLILLLIMLLLNTLIVGLILFYISEMDLMTSMLSCVPGGISDISLLSLDLGANSSIVAIMQLSRLVIVLLLFPLLVKELTYNHTKSVKINREITITNQKTIVKQIFTLILGVIGSLIGLWLDFPGGALVGSMVMVALFNCTTKQVSLAKGFKVFAQLLAGSLIGGSVMAETIIGIGDLLLPIIILISSYFILDIFYSNLCYKFKWLDQKSALFAACPAGASDMALIASDLGGDLKTIAIIQVARLIFAIAIVPQFILLIVRIVN